jgi:hypothetical protein
MMSFDSDSRKTAGILNAETPGRVVISGPLTEVKGASQLKDIKVSKLTSHVVYSLC